MSRHTLSVLVENKPGVLTRVAGLFARRSFNIHSLAVGTSEVDGLSRITVVVDVEELPLEQVTKQLNKLINVIKIVELDPAQSVQREHLLIKVRVDNSTRSQVLEAVNLFRARVVDVASDALVIEVTGDSGKTQALLSTLALRHPIGVAREELIGLIWPSSDTSLGGQSLNTLVSSVNRSLGDALGGRPSVVHGGGRYRHGNRSNSLTRKFLNRPIGHAFSYPRRLKYCTARSCCSAAARVLNVPRLCRLPVFGFGLRE